MCEISPYRHRGLVILRAAEHSDSVPRAVGASGGAFCEGVHTHVQVFGTVVFGDEDV